ncbi:hypothetical protein D3C80_2188030 [compost metagenome]
MRRMPSRRTQSIGRLMLLSGSSSGVASITRKVPTFHQQMIRNMASSPRRTLTAAYLSMPFWKYISAD